jgi:hypothetical protein
MEEADSLAEVVARERQLLDPRFRRQPQLVRALLDPDFMEYGASGRMWQVDAIVDALAAEEGFAETANEMAPVLLSRDVVLLTYRTESSERRCLRSSVWVRSDAAGWRLRFHQGTITRS